MRLYVEIFIYTLSVIYSPGPVNFMGLNAGLTGQFRNCIGFFLGVGCAMLVLFVLLGYLGEAFIPQGWLHYFALVGAIYIFYVAFKMLNSQLKKSTQNEQKLTFLNGFFIQLLNPKAILVVLPVTTIMYPAAHIQGIMIFVVSLLISLGASGAPCSYAFAGKLLGNKISNPIWLNRLNYVMAVLLMITGLLMLKDFMFGTHLI